MLSAFPPRAARFGLVAAAALGLSGLTASNPTAAAGMPDWPARVIAHYNVAFNGFDIGAFSFQAEIRGGDYKLTGNAEISALLGFVKWQGLTQTSGQVSTSTAEPSAYSFDYSSSAKSGMIRMAFRKGTVTTIAASPPAPRTPEMVPVERAHLKGVLDPLTAVIALTRPQGGDPCNQRLPVFDGMQRFDLTTSALGARPGPSGPMPVCEMRYRPIAGYKRGTETENLARGMKIELTMRPVPGAGLFVPQQIRIPTLVGSAVLSLRKIDILTSGHDQIAFAE